MNKKSKKLMKQLLRFEGLSHRYQMSRFRNFGPYANPHRGQGRVLSILKLQPEISQKELLFLLDMSKQSLGELLNKLERSGFIIRTPSMDDRRIMNIKLTPEGAEAANNIDTEQEEMEDIFGCLSEDEKDLLYDYLGRISEYLEKLLEGSSEFMGHMHGHFFHGHNGSVPDRSEFRRNRNFSDTFNRRNWWKENFPMSDGEEEED